jgi:hypothetical protein
MPAFLFGPEIRLARLDRRLLAILNRRPPTPEQTKGGLAGRQLLRSKEAAAVAIVLQSSVGGFSDEFMRNLPRVERTMIERGLEPSDFVISKDRASPSSLYVTEPFFYEYTVSFGEARFTVTEPTDVRFLDYFYQRCMSDEKEQTKPLPTLQRKPPGIISRLLRWMAQPI